MISVVRESPMVSTAENTLKRWISYHIAVVFVSLVALILQAVLGWAQLLFAIAQVLLAVGFTAAWEVARKWLRKEPSSGYLERYMQPLTAGLLAALLLPARAPLTMIVLAIVGIRFFTWLFNKMFKKVIIHPVLLSIVLIQLFFREWLPLSETMANIFQESSLSVGRFRFWFGFYEGLTLGTTAFILLGLLWIYLSVTRIIHFRMSVWYAFHLILLVLVLAVFTDQTLWLLFTRLLLGYSVFALVFFVAEPTATPETPEMMAFYPFLAAMLTAWLRLRFDLLEAALYALVFAQFVTWVFEQFQQRSTRRRVRGVQVLVGIIWIILLFNIWFF
ncbi:MAG: hypothetical protein EA374_03880 [Acholeplasmatales bacterium]|nr:MAG: hypothetical protein EA374_03880 [Acholeplasmatales bacterium]